MASSEGAKLTPGTENEDDSAISMLDVLEEQQELEENANAVLGDSDDRNCTYIMVWEMDKSFHSFQISNFQT